MVVWKIYLILKKIIAISLSTMLISMVYNYNIAGYYNKIVESRLEKILSDEVVSLIIVTVSGDKSYINKELENIYTKMYIIHLLVLSGSNIHTFTQFLNFISKKHDYNNFISQKLALLLYFCYVSFLHPLSRAFIFMLLYDFISHFGLRASKRVVTFLLVSVSVLVYVYLDFSLSFLLSALFATLIILYDSFCRVFGIDPNTIVSKLLIFPLFISASSIPIYYIFFGLPNLWILLLSNFIVVPTYEPLVLLSYLAYLLAFFPLELSHTMLLIAYPIDLFIRYITFLYFYFEIYNV